MAENRATRIPVEKGMGMKRTWWTLALTVAATTGCFRWYGPEKTIDAYIQAVQEREFQDSFRLMSTELREAVAGLRGEPLVTFEEYSRSMEFLNETFEFDRKKGKLHFSPEGVALIRILGLGKGAFYQVDVSQSRSRGDRAVIQVLVVLPYNLMDRPNHARPGMVFWRLRRPFGEVYPLLYGLPYTGRREELHSIRIRFDLTACEEIHEPSPTGWCVLSVMPMPETAEYQVVE